MDLSRHLRRSLNNLGRQEQELADKCEYVRTALEEERALVFSHALRANQEDLEEVARRLAGRRPEVSDVTVLMQEDVESRTVKLIEALERERERRAQEREGGGQQQEQGQNRDAKEPLVPVLAELEMLKTMELEMMARTRQMQQLVADRGGDGVTELETVLIERLGHRHHAVTEIFLQLKSQLEQALAPPEETVEGQEGK